MYTKTNWQQDITALGPTNLNKIEQGIEDAHNNKADIGHTHDSRYYTESETNAQMAGKSDTNHNHSGVYEPVISKNSGFNLNKSDSVTSTSTAVLATSKAAKTAYDKGVQALNTANAKLNSSLYTAADVLNKIKTVDGNGSGLDADLLDGAQKDTDGTLLGNSDSSIPTEKAVKTYVDVQSKIVSAGNYNIFKDGSSSSTDDTTYKKLKSFNVNANGSMRITFTLKTRNLSAGYHQIVHGRIYKNDVAVGTERIIDFYGIKSVTYTEDITVSAGDVVQFYAKCGGSVNTEAYIFDVYFAIGQMNPIVVKL